jgi:hypothetical protein
LIGQTLYIFILASNKNLWHYVVVVLCHFNEGQMFLTSIKAVVIERSVETLVKKGAISSDEEAYILHGDE